MSKYYRVILNNENDNYYCFVRNGKYFYIRVVVEEINGLYFELITGLEVVYSENGLYPGLSFYKKERLSSNDIGDLIEKFSILTKKEVVEYSNYIQEVLNKSNERYKEHFNNLRKVKKIKEYQTIFREYIKGSEENDK